jgi:hypothetical protein
MLYVFNSTGGVYAAPITLPSAGASAPVLGDIKGNGKLEMIAEAGGILAAYNPDGSAVTGWPVTLDGGAVGVWPAPVVTDVRGGGNHSIIQASGDQGLIYALNANGTPVTGWPKTTNEPTTLSPAFGKITGTTSLFVAEAYNAAAGGGAVTELAIGVDASTTSTQWPMTWRDAAHTGSYPLVTVDTVPPLITILTPAAGSTVFGNISVSGTASDNVGLLNVKVAIDTGTYSVAAGTSTWTFPLNTRTLINGSHTANAAATDTSNNVTRSSVTFIVNNVSVASVTITSPTDGATISGTVLVLGTAAPSSGATLTGVQIAIDGGAYTSAAGTTSWTYTLNAGALSSGTHTIHARASDSLSTTGTMSIGVTVSGGAAPPATKTPGLYAAFAYPNPAIKTNPVIRVSMGVVNSIDFTIFDISGNIVHSGSLTGAPTGVAPNGLYYYDYVWRDRKPSGVYFAVIHGKAPDGSIIKARVKFAVIQ